MRGIALSKVSTFRESVDKVVSLLTERGLTVTQQGVGAYVRYGPNGMPISVNIPQISDAATDRFIAAIRGFIDHEVAHVLESDGLELVSAITSSPKVKNLINVVEDIRIERAISKRFPGSARHIEDVWSFVTEDSIAPALKTALEAGDEQAIMASVLPTLLHAWGGKRVSQDFMNKEKVWDVIGPLVKTLEPFKERLANASMKSTSDAISLARGMFQAIEDASRPLPPPPPPAPPVEEDEKASEEPTDEKGEEEAADGAGDSENAEPDADGEAEPDAEENADADAAPGDGGAEPEAEPEADAEPGDGDADGDEDEEDEAARHEREQQELLEEAEQAEADADEDEDTDEGESGDGDADAGEDTPGEEEEDDAQTDGTGGAEGDEKNEEGEEKESDTGSAGDGEEGEADGATSDTAEPEGESEPGQGEEGDQEGPRLAGGGSFLGEMKDMEEAFSTVATASAIREMTSDAYLPYTADWTTWIPADVLTGGEKLRDKEAALMEASAGQMVGQLSNQFRRLFAQKALSVAVGGLRSGRLNSPALYRLKLNDDRVFFRREEHNAQDTAVTLLVDCSGSMASEKKIDLALAAACIFSETLERVGIVHEILGFTTTPDLYGAYNGYPASAATGVITREVLEQVEEDQGKMGRSYSHVDAIRMIIFKTFQENFRTGRARLAAMRMGVGAHTPVKMGANIDGESVELAARRLSQRTEERKVMIVLSDGTPAANGDPRHLNAHLKHVVKTLEKQKVEIVGIGIMSDAVRHFYSKYVVLNNVADLPGAVMRELSKILLGGR